MKKVRIFDKSVFGSIFRLLVIAIFKYYLATYGIDDKYECVFSATVPVSKTVGKVLQDDFFAAFGLGSQSQTLHSADASAPQEEEGYTLRVFSVMLCCCRFCGLLCSMLNILHCRSIEGRKVFLALFESDFRC